MKKKLFLFLSALLTMQGAWAQDDETVSYGLFNHLSIGASAGTDGVGFDLAAPVASFLSLRAGVSFWPKLSYTTNIEIDDNNPLIESDVDIKGKLNAFNAKLLADLYPSRSSSFHFTVGAFLGNDDIITATNTSMFIKDPKKYGKLGIKLGEQRISTDENGYITADVTVNKLKPYLGLGFGRAVPKNRIGVSFDFGVQFWGKPRLGAITKDDWGNETYHRFSYEELDEYDDEDLKDGLEIAEKICVFPVLNIRLSGRIF